MAMAELGVFNGTDHKEEPAPPPKKCLLDGCEKHREGNKLFCCREHFGKYQRLQRKD